MRLAAAWLACALCASGARAVDLVNEDEFLLGKVDAAVTGEPHFVALQSQRPLQHVGDFAVVLDHEHAW